LTEENRDCENDRKKPDASQERRVAGPTAVARCRRDPARRILFNARERSFVHIRWQVVIERFN
jgi:hypothetical protein